MQKSLLVEEIETQPIQLKLVKMGINTLQEPIVYIAQGCFICRVEGIQHMPRVKLSVNASAIIANINVVESTKLGADEIGLSDYAWELLGAKEGETAHISYLNPIESLSHVRSKLYGKALDKQQFSEIIHDISLGKYNQAHLAAFISSCIGNHLHDDEISYLTQAMVEVGDKLTWSSDIVLDKHGIGGLPGNRTTPIVVSIVAANGLLIPKTSSRAITSPAGTADTMECITNVELDIKTLTKVVEAEGGCFAWGGSVNLSPADDILIRTERALEVDSEGQMIASILSKKIAAGSTHVIIDIPVGPTAKVRSKIFSEFLCNNLVKIGQHLGIDIIPVVTDGAQPVGKGVGPTLEMRDVLKVLNQDASDLEDLTQKSIMLAGRLLEIGNKAKAGQGEQLALKTLQSGKALKKFHAICEKQGGLKTLETSQYQKPILAGKNGIVSFINNRFVAKLAKLAGAPQAKTAGLDFHIKLGQVVEKNDPILTIHAAAQSDLDYALEFLKHHPNEILIEDERL